MSVPLVVCDLDRTLIYSRAALGEDPPPVRCVEVYDGARASFLTEVAFGLLTRLQALSVFVPTTTRTVAQLGRVELPAPPSRWAIAANGGHILDHGVSDRDWHAGILERLDTECAPLADVRAWFDAAAGAPWLLRAQEADNLFSYAIVDRTLLSADVRSELGAWAAERGWTVSLQGRKLYVVPAPLTKSAAAAEVAARVGATRTLAAGDSLLDTDLLAWADEAVRPAHGELQSAGWSRPDLVVTVSAGVRGGEQVVATLLARVQAHLTGLTGTPGSPPRPAGPSR